MYLERAIERAENDAISAQNTADTRGHGADLKIAEHKKEIATWLKEIKDAREILKRYEDGKLSEVQALQQIKEALKEIPNGQIVMPRHIGWPERR